MPAYSPGGMLNAFAWPLTYSNPELVNQLHAMGIQAAFWTVDTQDAVRSLLPLGPDCIVTNRPDRVREWVNAEMRK